MLLKAEITDGVTLDVDDDSNECHEYLLKKGKLTMAFFDIPDEIKDKFLESKGPGYMIINPETKEIYRKGFLDNRLNELCELKGLTEFKPLIFTHNKTK